MEKPNGIAPIACSVFKKCGACTKLDIPYKEQLQQKDEYIRSLFQGICDRSSIFGIIGMDDPYCYRNKVASPFAPGKRKRAGREGPGPRSNKAGAKKAKPAIEILTGMYAKGTHQLVSTDDCLIENEIGKSVIKAVRQLMQKWQIAPYDEDTGTGFMRHVVVRIGHNSGEVLVTLVTNSREFPSSKSFCRELVRRVPEITTIVQNINLRQTNVILGDMERTLYGPGFILDTLCGLSFRISSHSFYQVNARQTEVLYGKAIELAGIKGHELVVDAYCGTGTIGLVAAKSCAGHVIGIDNVGSAIKDARENAKHNGIENAEFVTADATQFMLDLSKEPASEFAETILMMDPPRAGSTPEFLNAAVKMNPSKIVYISCNPETQVRDVRQLVDSGYIVRAIQPVDMFPNTDHIESIVLMVKSE